ncbi:MAG: hypothetical protein JOS17DRAFT_571062 [Linnemannia elongata]|nr:MAG: hypothetical protein JOS17DRAFT_571062 [Linnemannia elongata]
MCDHSPVLLVALLQPKCTTNISFPSESIMRGKSSYSSFLLHTFATGGRAGECTCLYIYHAIPRKMNVHNSRKHHLHRNNDDNNLTTTTTNYLPRQQLAFISVMVLNFARLFRRLRPVGPEIDPVHLPDNVTSYTDVPITESATDQSPNIQDDPPIQSQALVTDAAAAQAEFDQDTTIVDEAPVVDFTWE